MFGEVGIQGGQKDKVWREDTEGDLGVWFVGGMGGEEGEVVVVRHRVVRSFCP